jgi:hypothetical protein
MFCPKCSQEQISEEVRYCSKCGFQLDAVRSLISGEEPGTLAGDSDLLQSARKKYAIFGASIMLVFALIVALFTVSLRAPTPLGAVLIPLIFFWLLLVLVILLSKHAGNEVARLFSNGPRVSASIENGPAAPGLREGYSPPAAQSLWEATTSEFEPIPSVTERTTNLLDNKE